MTPQEVIARWLASGGVWEREVNDATAILAALDAAGFAVVPKEPTEAMDEVGYDAIAMEVAVVGEGIEIAEGAPERIYRAMLAAAKEDRA